MRKGIHPENYREVIVKDISCDHTFKTRSTANTKETIVWEDGKEYPLIKVEISSESHPFFTGKMKFVDTAGRIEKFNKKFGKRKSKNPAMAAMEEEAPTVENAATEAPVAEAKETNEGNE